MTKRILCAFCNQEIYLDLEQDWCHKKPYHLDWRLCRKMGTIASPIVKIRELK
jgi:hypothetical protein